MKNRRNILNADGTVYSWKLVDGKWVEDKDTDSKSKKDNTIYYVLGGVVLLGVILFFVLKKK